MTGRPEKQAARVALLLQDLKFGGSQSQALELAGGMDPERFQCEVWTLTAGEGLQPRAERLGVKVRGLGQAGYVLPPALAGLARMLRRQRPHILVMYTGIPNIWGRLLGRALRVPLLLAACRGTRAIGLQREKALWRLAHHHICNAGSLRVMLRERLAMPPGRISVIPNGVDAGHFRPRPNAPADSRAILSLGRLSPEKGHRMLLAAFARIAPKHPRARLTLVGDGPEKPALERIARQGALQGRVKLLPGDLFPVRHYQKAGILALPSEHEGMPNVVMEAMACGLATAACRVGGTPELVEHKKTGLLTPPGDENAMASALDYLLSNPAQARAWGQAGRKAMKKRFSLGAMIEAHECLFTRLLENRRHDK